MQWEILMHSTLSRKIKNILKVDRIDIVGDDDTLKDYPGSSPAVYFHYLFDGMKNQDYMNKQYTFWNYGTFRSRNSRPILCFDVKMLKDLPFRVCEHMNAGCYKKDKETLMEKSGNLKRMPNLTFLRSHINHQMENVERGSNMAYVDSHEIIIVVPVPVRKYLRYIIVRGKEMRIKVQMENEGLNVPIIDTQYLYRRMRVKHWTAQCAAMEYMSKHGAGAGSGAGERESEAIMDAIVAKYKAT